MKRFFVRSALLMLLVSFVLALTGCTDQMGETVAEGSRRHKRVLRINRQQMMSDIDTFLMLEKPSSRHDLTIP